MIPIFKTKNWKENLPRDDESRLNEILKNVQKYRSAYNVADDIKNAQLWCAILELRKENLALLRRLERIEEIFDSIIEKLRKQEREKRGLVESLERF